VIETTYHMEAYFGVALSPAQACRFWHQTFLQRRYPGPASLFRPVFVEPATELRPEAVSDLGLLAEAAAPPAEGTDAAPAVA
jgi:hypothetical protein